MYIGHATDMYTHMVEGLFGIGPVKKQYFTALEFNLVQVAFAHSATYAAYRFFVNKL
jgi:hypothetical protein